MLRGNGVYIQMGMQQMYLKHSLDRKVGCIGKGSSSAGFFHVNLFISS